MLKIVFVGAGGRCHSMFTEPIFNDFKEQTQICGLYDVNVKRAQVVAKYCGNPPVYQDFYKMLDEVRPHYVAVTTTDATHHEYIIAALEKGYDVITEKPMTIDEEKCNAILAAEKRTGKMVIVTFNCRFMPLYSEIKQLLNKGIVGRVMHIDYQYMLDSVHGAEYFRRWHSRMANSGSLLVHKSTHHFDVINWFLSDVPEVVSAFGTQTIYGKNGKFRGERCLTCSHKAECKYYFDFKSLRPIHTELYLETESEDGYIRDRCVFNEDVDIYDTMSVQVKYKSGTLLQYALTTCSPYEGWKMIINGTEGRLEVCESNLTKDYDRIEYYDLHGKITTFQIPKGQGLHNGGDAVLRKALFGTGYDDTLGRLAGAIDGAYSLLVGVAANHSIKKNTTINICELLE